MTGGSFGKGHAANCFLGPQQRLCMTGKFTELPDLLRTSSEVVIERFAIAAMIRSISSHAPLRREQTRSDHAGLTKKVAQKI